MIVISQENCLLTAFLYFLQRQQAVGLFVCEAIDFRAPAKGVYRRPLLLFDLAGPARRIAAVGGGGLKGTTSQGFGMR